MGFFDLGLEGFVVGVVGKVDEVVRSGMSLLITAFSVDKAIGGLGGVVLGCSGSETSWSSEPSSLEW